MIRLLAVSWVCAVATAQVEPVRGLVVDEAGQPLQDVAVVAFAAEEPFVTDQLLRTPTTHTASDGTFALDLDRSARPWLGNVLFATPGRVHVVAGIACVDMTPVVLPKAKRLAGRARDATGKALAGVRVEARDYLARCKFLGRYPSNLSTSPEPRTAVRTDASGRFVLEGVCDTMIWLVAGGQRFTRQEYGPLAAGDSFDVEVAPAPVVTVQVVDGAGKPVSGASVTATSESLPQWLGYQTGTTDAEGHAEVTFLAAPTSLWVQTEDFRPLANATLTAPQAEVRLVAQDAPQPAAPDKAPEPRVFGRVVDPDTGRAVVGAKIAIVGEMTGPPDHYVLDNTAVASNLAGVMTDADGRFALPAEDGERWLVATDGSRSFTHDRGRAPSPRTINLVPGAELRGLELTLQPTVTVSGKVRGPLPRGSQVRFLVQRESRWSSETMEYRPRAALDGQQRFGDARLLARRYDVQVLSPRLFRQGMPDKVSVASVVIDGKPIEVDAGGAVPATVRGVVQTPLPPQRVAVVLLPTAHDDKLVSLGYASYDGPACPLGLDGEFALRGAAGGRTLALIDILTGVVLAHRDLGNLAPGEDREITFKPEVQPVQVCVRFASLPASDTLWLDVRVADEHWLQVGQIVKRSADSTGGVGTRVPRATRELTLWLPPGQTLLRLRTQEGVRSDGTDALASLFCDSANLPNGCVELKAE
ncbi:MAG: Ig-like domain-containing protein [Planctomycetota bacterium]